MKIIKRLLKNKNIMKKHRYVLIIVIAFIIAVSVLFVKKINRLPEAENCEIHYNYE